MNILYLSHMGSHTGREFLSGRGFIDEAKAKHEVFVRHCCVESKAAYGGPAQPTDVTDRNELAFMDPDVIVSENGFYVAPGSPRLPFGYMEDFFESGGVFLVEGNHRTETMNGDDRLKFMDLLRVRPKETVAGAGEVEIRDHAGGQWLTLPSDQLGVPDWLAAVNHPDDLVSAVTALAVAPKHGGEVLAYAPAGSTVLASDQLLNIPHPAWATVARIRNGFAVYIAANFLHDVVTDRYPDNIRWTLRLLDFLHDEAARDLERVAPQRAVDPSYKSSIRDAIEAGESLSVEFKESGYQPKVMREEVAVAVSAFMNAEGGTLLLGVSDDGGVVGVDGEIQGARGVDKYLLRLNDLLRDRLDPVPVGSAVVIVPVEMDGKTVIALRVRRSRDAVWCTDKRNNEQALYVRTNNLSQKLDARTSVEFAARRRG